jgi:2-C-methyl-D-erythritol 4-phosphate cytidylyltransferase
MVQLAGKTVAILTAAGAGTRLGRAAPKALVEIDGTALVVHAARRLAASGVVDAIVITSPAGIVDVMCTAAVADEAVTVPVRVTPGGCTRQESVAAGLALVDVVAADADVVLVHDAARPFASPDLVRRVVAAVRAGHRAVVPGLPVVDTVKIVSGPPTGTPASDPASSSDGVAIVVATPDRSTLRAVQTPQGFDRELLVRAHAAAQGGGATDDAGLVEALGEPVVVVDGEESACKITTERDLSLAERYAGSPA